MLIIIATLLIAACAAAIAALPAFRGQLERLLVGLVAGYAGVTIVMLVAGLLLQSLDARTVLLAAGVAAGGGGALARWAASRGTHLARPTRAHLVALARVAAWPPNLILLVAAVASAGWRLLLGVRLPPIDYDGVSYHLVNVATWLQHGAITDVPFRPWTQGYPAGGELLTAWLAMITGSTSLTDLTGLAGLPLALVAAIALARWTGAAPRLALFAGLLVAITPALVILGSTTYVDVLMAGAVTAGFALLLRAAQTARAGGAPAGRTTALLLVAGTAVGLAVGIKATAIAPLGLAVVAALVVVGLAGDEARVRRFATAVAAIGGPAVAIGGWWYLRNIVEHANPLWPITFGPFAGLGPVDTLVAEHPAAYAGMGVIGSLLTSWTSDNGIDRYAYDVRVGGFGIAWVPLLALAVVGAIVVARRRQLLPLGIVVGPAAIALLVMPMSWFARLTLFIVPPVIALAAVAISRIPQKRATLVVAVVIAALGLRSLAVATVSGNFDGLGSGREQVSVVTAGDVSRRAIGLWATCSGLNAIPAGAHVETIGYNLVGLVAGQQFEHILADPVADTTDPAALLASLRAVGATHVVADGKALAVDAAAMDPTDFAPLGETCGLRIYALAPVSP